jgi:hypothetical protein
MQAQPIEEQAVKPLLSQYRAKSQNFSTILGRQTAGLISHCDSAAGMTGSSAESGPLIPEDAVVLGTISSENPTVSNLLIKHPVYGKDCWNIIYSDQNRAKPYTRIQTGTVVYLEPKTLEILWNHPSGFPAPEPLSPPPKMNRQCCETRSRTVGDPKSISERMVSAVKQHVGKPYEEINCYELLVEGLKELGVRYHGSGGLAQRLVKMAAGKGLPKNAYLNGEGLIASSGSRVYYRSISGIRDSDAQARKVIREMEPLLKNGYILSFSTPTRGHTGIVSQNDINWTFINSGRMDHLPGTDQAPKGVGEESLYEEIRNWFRLAARRGESLQITLGCLNEEKLALDGDHRLPVSETV